MLGRVCSQFLNYKVLIQSIQGESVRTVLQRFYLTRETVNNNKSCVTSKERLRGRLLRGWPLGI